MTTTSGTTTFTMDVEEIIEQALDPLGGEHQSNISASKARRVLNLLLIQLQNKEIPLSKIDTIDLALDADEPTYLLTASVKDVLSCSVSKTASPGVELPISRMSLKAYHNVPLKAMEGPPNSFVTERKSDGVYITFWPVQPDATYTAHILVAKTVEDVTASYQKLDLPTRYLPLIVAWLTYALALTKATVIGPEKIAMFKANRDELMPDTFEEDRERTDYTVVPGGISGR